MSIKNETLSLAISNPINFIYKRSPNPQEVITSAASQATVDLFSGRIKQMFGDNPTAPAIFRDISKIPSTYANYYSNNSIANTGIKYDEGSLYAHSSKIACKPFFLFSFSQFFPTSDFSVAARSSNFICEIPSRFLNIVSRDKQKVESVENNSGETDFLFYASQKALLPSLWLEAAGESSLKTIVSDQLGEVSKNLGYIQYIRSSTTFLDNLVISYLGGITQVTEKDDIYSKAFICFSNFGTSYNTPISVALIMAIDWTSKFSTELINAFFLGTPTRTAQDLTGIGIRESYNYIADYTGKTFEYVEEI